MPKTEVILIQNIVGLGAESDQVKVAAGYARNYLIPQGLAVPLTGANKRRLEVLRQRRIDRESHELNAMTELGKTLAKMTLVIQVKTGEDGKMFGAVTPGTITDELKQQFEVSLERKKIQLPAPLRALGEHEIELRLHPEVHTSLKVRIESTTPLPKPEATKEPHPARGEGRRTEPRRGEGRPESRKPEAKRAESRKSEAGKERQTEPRRERPERKPKSDTAGS